MKSRTSPFSAIALISLLFIPISLAAQDNEAASSGYVLKDLGNLGGKDAYLFTGPPSFRVLNHQGVVVDAAGTGTFEKLSPCFTDCTINHAVRWQNGILTDLGRLPGGSSAPFSISENGTLIVGVSENGSVDPLTGYPEYRAVLWRDGHAIKNLGTFGGNFSVAVSVNNLGQVVGGATNATPDHYAAGLGPCWSLDCWPSATEWRAFLWQHGAMTDLGTLGTGHDAVAGMVNASGQVAGISYTNTAANHATGVPTQDPFFWEQGNGMVDTGTLGGTLGYPTWLNNKGQMVGQSNLTGDKKYHPFLWEKGKQMQDLGTLGGDSGTANWINEAGEIVGGAWTTGNQAVHAVLWRNRTPQDLGVLPGFKHSIAFAINSKSQVVGCLTNNLAKGCICEFSICAHAFLWENGTMFDLNKLIPRASGVKLMLPLNINDRGEIATWGTPDPNFTHAILLVPRQESFP
jgi:probable HAF family extracellular repeat protein